MSGLLPAAAFGLVPSDQLLSRELHAAGRIGLREHQMTPLVESCTDYTEDADALLVGMAGLVASIHLTMFGATLPTEQELETVDEQIVDWADRALELGRAWVRHRMNALRELDAEQVRKVSAVQGDVLALLLHALRPTPRSVSRQTART